DFIGVESPHPKPQATDVVKTVSLDAGSTKRDAAPWIEECDGRKPVRVHVDPPSVVFHTPSRSETSTVPSRMDAYAARGSLGETANETSSIGGRPLPTGSHVRARSTLRVIVEPWTA